jgi:predicted DNA binding protein/GAF domain-containing protein
MVAVGLQGEFTVLFLDADAGAAAEAALAVERADESAATAIELTAEGALDRLGVGEADCLVVTDALSEADPVETVERARDRFDGPIVFAPRDGTERLATEAVAAGATEYVPLEDGDGIDARRPGRLADRVEAALAEAREDRTELSYRSVFEELSAGIAVVEDGTVLDSNDRFDAVSGVDDAVGRSVEEVVPRPAGRRVEDLLASPTGPPERVTVGRDDGTELALHAIGTASGTGRGILLARERTRRGDRRRRLEALDRATREVVRAGRPVEVAEVVADAVAETVSPPTVRTYLYDGESGELRQAAAVSGGLPRRDPSTGTPRGADGTEEFAWSAFVAGERTHESDPSRVAFPLGDHGVLVVTGDSTNGFAESDVAFAGALATTARAGLAALNRDELLEERTKRLRERTDSLEELRRIDGVVRDVGQLLVDADDRSAIEQAVCERLAAVDGWSFAWVGKRRVDGGGIEVSAAAQDDGFLDAVVGTEGTPFDGTPAVTAAESGTWDWVEDIVAHPSGSEWRELALEYGYRSVVSVPLVRDGREYGVLEVYGNRTDAFGEADREVLVELGSMTAYAVHAVERERALQADSGPELVVETEAVPTFLRRLATETEGTVDVTGVVPQSDGEFRFYLSVESPLDDVEPVVSRLVDRSKDVPEFRSVGDSPRFEVRFSGAPLVERVAANGGRIHGMTATGSGGKARIELRNALDVRGFVDALQSVDPELTVTAQRSAGEESTPLRPGVTDRLTDRQREVLEVAFYSGFFEWPRESTGEEVAETLGIAPPTFHKHVRTAEWKLLRSVLDGPGQ